MTPTSFRRRRPSRCRSFRRRVRSSSPSRPASTSYGNESSVTISATVTSGTSGSPTGSVVVQNGGDTVCTIALQPATSNTASGSCPTLGGTQLPPGKYALTANYPGDGNYQSSVSSARSLAIANDATQGYWEVGSDGGIFSFGTAHFYGSTGGTHLNAPIVGIASTQDGAGYWEVAKRRRGVRLWRRPLLRVDGGNAPERTHRRDRLDP